MAEKHFVEGYRLMQRYVGWTEEDAMRVASLSRMVLAHADELIADFYAEIRRHPQAAAVITGGSEQINRLSKSLRQWLVELLAGQYDDDYMARRWRVGYRHVEIGLAQRFTSLALSRLRAGIVHSVQREWRGDPDERLACLVSLHKLIDLEHALIQDAYEYEHVRRERELERARGERRFRHLVESASCLIMMLRADRTLIYFNPFAEQITGYSAANLAELPTGALALLGGEPSDSGERFRTVLASGDVASYEAQVTVRDGAPRWIHWTLSRLDQAEEGAAVLAVGHDVTEQKRAAHELLQASRLATIGEMYARLAHESRNALQRLQVCTEMLSDQVADNSSAAALVDRSQHAQEDLRRLLDEVRNFAAPMTLELTECRLPALWREAWQLLQVQRKGRQAELADIGCENIMPILGDRFRLVQAFRNMFENSLAACRDPVEITITCRDCSLEDAPAMELSIEDNGPGFDEAGAQRAFDPFFTTKSTGTGLGLAIVHRTIEAHGGRVAAGRGRANGARISIVLPYALRQGKQAPH
jgi:two-component system, LuxR family, sensor kinase FixL